MTFTELTTGMQVRLRAVPFTVAAVDALGATLEAPGRWSVLRVAPDGRLFDVTGAQVGRRGPGRALQHTLDDVVPASS